MASTNEITGAAQQSKQLTPQGKENLSAIFDHYFVFWQGKDVKQLNETPLSYQAAKRLAKDSVSTITDDEELIVLAKQEDGNMVNKEFMDKSGTFYRVMG